jgi:branched-chain amino acid transport system substrate-binding protein
MPLVLRLLALALLSVATALPSHTLAQESDAGAGVVAAPAQSLSHRAHAAAYMGATSEMVFGFYVNALREVDAHAQTFRADLFYWLRYKRRGPGLVDEELEEIRFVNGDVESQELEERKALDDFNYVMFRVRAQFHFHADFRRYPFDVQELPIEVQHGFLRADQFHITPDRFSYDRSARPKNLRGLGEGIDLMEMHVTDVRHEETTRTYRTDFGDRTDPLGSTTVSAYRMVIVAARDVLPFLIKIVIPLLIIQILAYLVFFVAADRIDVAVGLTVTSLLASIAFQISLSDSLPDIGYLTTADRIFHLSYFLIMSAMGQMVYAYNLFMAGRLEHARKIDVLGRILYPLVFFGGVAIICWSW